MTKKLIFIALFLFSIKLFASTPGLSNFRIENSEKNRVYFDSSEPISGSSSNGFIISGKTITSVTVNSDQTVGHYFVVSSAFDFWDNNTIRYIGGSDLKSVANSPLNPFILSYIKNNIPEPESNLFTYYIATNGSDSNSGTSESAAFKTLQKALNVAKAGSTIYMKAGRYVSSSHTTTQNSGTSTSPIKIIGYKNTPGDITSMYYSFSPNAVAPDLDPSEMPMMDGENTNKYGIHTDGEDYIIIRNVQVTRYNLGFNHWDGIGYILDNCIAKEFYGDGSREGAGINFYPSNSGTAYTQTKFRVINSISMNSGMANVSLKGAYSLIDNVKTYCDKSGGGGDLGSDYFIAVTGDHNIIRNSSVEAIDNTVNSSSHGFSARGASYNDGNAGSSTSYNLFEKLYVRSGSNQGLQSRNPKTDFNVWKDIEIVGFGTGGSHGDGISNQTGAQNNIYTRISLKNLNAAFEFSTGSEGGSNPAQLHTSGNVMMNMTVENVQNVIGIHTAVGNLGTYENNKFYNITVNNAGRLFENRNHTASNFASSNNELTNWLINNVNLENKNNNFPFLKDMFAVNNSNFYLGFEQPSWASNSSSINPRLDGNLKFTAETPPSIYDGGVNLTIVNHDIEGNIRVNGKYSMGAYEDLIPSVGSVGPDVTICNGESTTLTASGGTSYSWNTGEELASITVNPSSTTTYTVTVTNGGVSDSHEVTVTVNEAPSVDLGEDQIICSEDSITLTAVGEGDFLWSTGETTETIEVSPSTTTTYSVTASNSCNTSVTDEVLITVNANITVDLGEDVIMCSGETITLTATGAGPFMWSTGEITPSIEVSPLSTTTYTVDSSNEFCSDSDEITVTVNDVPSVDLGEDKVICEGEDVTLTAVGEGEFLWNTGETTASILVSPLSTTIYTVTASNSCSTSVTDEIEISVNPIVTVDLGSDITMCSGETVTLTATGTGPFNWSTGETTSSIDVSPSITTTYSVDSTNGICSDTDEITVIVNVLPSVDAGSDLNICEGEVITLTAIGEGDFMWNTGETTASIEVSPSTTSMYSVTASNSCSTSVTDEVEITVNPNVTVDLGADVSICSGETITLSATGSGPFNWSTGETTASIDVSPSDTTTYTIDSTNGFCSDSDEITVTVNVLPTVNAGADMTICEGDDVTLTAIGEGDFLWSTGETSSSILVSPSSTTTYSVTASNSCSTTASDEIEITVNPSVTVELGADFFICSGETVTITATGSGPFSWNTGETTASINVSPSITTTYMVESTNGICSDSDEINVTVNMPPSISLGSDMTICEGDVVILTAIGESDFLWNTGETTASIEVSPSTTTIYSVIASNSCSTPVTDEIQIIVTPNVTVDLGPDVSICSGETVTLIATGTGPYNWSTGETTSSIDVSPSNTTTYSVSSSNGICSDSDEIKVTVNSLPSVNAGSDMTICEGDIITLTAIGEGDFLWSTGETTASIEVSPSTTTTYSVATSNSCSDGISDTVVVTVNPAIGLTLGNDVSICNGENVTLTATGNGDFLWSTGETTSSITVAPSNTTTYTVVSSIGNCNETDDIVVTVNQSPSVALGSDQSICYGESVTLTATGTGEFLWNTGETTSSITVSPLFSTTYTVTLIASCGANNSDEVRVNVFDPPVVDVGDDLSIDSGASVTLVAEGGAGDFLWSTGETTSSIVVSPSSKTVYTVSLTSKSGCSDEDTVVVDVSPLDSSDSDSRINVFDQEVTVYPNPTNGLLNINVTDYSEKINISVFNLSGQIMYSENFDKISNDRLTHQINLSKFGTGVYIVRLSTRYKSSSKKVLVI